MESKLADWIESNVGKRLRMRRKFIGCWTTEEFRLYDPLSHHFDDNEFEEQAEGVITTDSVKRNDYGGWYLKAGCIGIMCYDAKTKENGHAILVQAPSGNVFQDTFYLCHDDGRVDRVVRRTNKTRVSSPLPSVLGDVMTVQG